MVQDFMEIIEDPNPGLRLVESLLKLNARIMLNISCKYVKKFSFSKGILNKRI
jgi:hypothetical protein